MGIVYSSIIDAPIYEVFDWHARPMADICTKRTE